MEPVKPSRADKARNREAILDAAAAVLARDPDPTLFDIAAEAGVGRATIYRHFATLQAVREALAEEVQDLARDLLQQHFSNGMPDAPLTQWLPAMVRDGLGIRTRYADAMAKEPDRDAGLLRALAPILEALIRQAQSRSEVRSDVDPEIMSEALITVGLHVARKVHRDGLPPEQAMQVFDTLLRGMEARAPRA